MFSFRSDSVEDHMKNVITEILSRDELTDVTLVCDDQVGFRAHKVVLAGGSKLFQQIFQVNTTAPLVRVEGMGERELLWIIQYLYYGEVSLDKSDQETFMKAVKLLQIKDNFNIVDLAEDDLIDNIDHSISNQTIKQNYQNYPEEREELTDNNVELEEEVNAEDDMFHPSSDALSTISSDSLYIEFPLSPAMDSTQTSPKKVSSWSVNLGKRKIPPSNYRFSCGPCDYKTNLKNDYDKHIMFVHKRALKTCPECGKQFENIDLHLRFHQASKEVTALNSYSEPQIPPSSTQRRSSVIKATNGYSNETDKDQEKLCRSGEKGAPRTSTYFTTIYKCDTCAAVFYSYTGLVYHHRYVHNLTTLEHIYPNFVCRTCDFQCRYKDIMKKHIATAHSDVVQLIQCDLEYCETKFFSRKSKDKHMKTHQSSTYIDHNKRSHPELMNNDENDF